MTRVAASFGGLFVLGALGACSAILPEIEIDCEDNCAALNQHEKLGAEDCFIYQCRADKKGCEMRPRDDDGDGVPDRATCGDAGVASEGGLDCDDSTDARVPDAQEVCDGVDNDCDEVIDEGALDGSFSIEVPPLALGSSSAQLSYAATDNGRLDLASNDVQLFEVQREGSAPVEVMANCAATEETTLQCKFADLAIAATEKIVFAAGINTSNCPQGQVRVGMGRDWSDFSWQHTPESALRLGIDPQVGADRPCAGGQGATGVRVGLFEGSGANRGLMLWRAANVKDSEERSPHEPADLRGILLALPSVPNPTNLSTAMPAKSELVSAGPGFESALVTWPDPRAGGFFVAYDAPGSIELGFIPHAAILKPLSEGLQRGDSILEGQPRHVALALNAHSSSSDDLALAAAWRDGSQLRFAAIAHHPNRAVVLQAGEVIPIPNDGPPIFGPVLVYQPTGFRTATENGGADGWYVLWLEQNPTGDRVRASRIARGQLEAEPAFDVYEQHDIRGLFAYSRPSASARSTQAMVAFVADNPGAELHTGSLGCGKR